MGLIVARFTSRLARSARASLGSQHKVVNQKAGFRKTDEKWTLAGRVWEDLSGVAGRPWGNSYLGEFTAKGILLAIRNACNGS
jgi:hypothetical protein